jgi:hypothetical protein
MDHPLNWKLTFGTIEFTGTGIDGSSAEGVSDATVTLQNAFDRYAADNGDGGDIPASLLINGVLVAGANFPSVGALFGLQQAMNLAWIEIEGMRQFAKGAASVAGNAGVSKAQEDEAAAHFRKGLDVLKGG